eukprot:comp24198_c0_seq1/m.44425 comp24198_c0_seq1/g.44425  ORF comp24198_c0_seq1/g.44425 comp24198_c0_seq1/m.44425 type:complete len:757 (-) comp24198_c0_seq1:546-2816(-)
MAAPHAKQSIAVFTSGGDAPGMNAAVRAIVRVGLSHGHDVYAIYEGYEGLVQGGDFIKQMSWGSVSMMLHRGGTVIGSARCASFRERPGRLAAAENLLKRKITNLICIGGDGSLTGANLFKNEWPSLLEELVATGRVSQELATECSYLCLVGLVGSIDNDMVYDGELTIGTDTALHRIVEAIDAVSSTAASHQRTFVMEVMGRHCGYLAWGAAVACGGDFVLIPEAPPETDDWAKVMCDKLEKRRKRGRRMNLVIVAEGAIDRNLKDIKSADVAKVLVDVLKHDTRVTILGHVQRGGMTSAYDRLMATITGAAAVEKVIQATKGDPATIVGLQGTQCIYAPLVETVAATQAVAKYTSEKNFAAAIKQRGKNFDRDYRFHRLINGTDPKLEPGTSLGEIAIAILHCGAPCAGMNSAVRAAARFALNRGYTVYGIANGFTGFEKEEMREINFMDVNGWAFQGGAKMGTNRAQPKDFDALSSIITAKRIQAILVVGGFESFTAVMTMKKARQTHPAFNIPLVQIPATISNNCPGTDWSLGCDTALNAICDALDRCKVSADASRHRVFLVETQGAHCGFLAAMAALASGAHRAYIPEEGCTLDDIRHDIAMIEKRMECGGRYSVIVKNEYCSDTFNLDFMYALYQAEGKGKFTVRQCSLGHLCQGLNPSPLDRIRSAKLAARSIEFMSDAIKSKAAPAVVIGFSKGDMVFTDVDELAAETDSSKRLWKRQWFLKYLPLVRQLAKYDDDASKVDISAAYNI